MLLRMRWFAIGVAMSIGAMTYLAAKVKRAREKITARAMLRSTGRTAASLLDRAADRITPDRRSH